MSFWGLLQFVSIIGISNINIFHDSKVLIECINGNYNIQALVLKKWYERVQLLKIFFTQISFTHVSRYFNVMTDSLSKKAINIKSGYLFFQEFMEGNVLHEGEVDLIDMA